MTGKTGRPIVIAIDGPAASGKGTLARRLAAEFGLVHLDTGLTFRAVADVASSSNTQSVAKTIGEYLWWKEVFVAGRIVIVNVC